MNINRQLLATALSLALAACVRNEEQVKEEEVPKLDPPEDDDHVSQV